MTTRSRTRSLNVVWIGMFVLTVAYAPTVFAQKEITPPLKFRVKFEQLARTTVEVVGSFEWTMSDDFSLSGGTRSVSRITYPTITLQHVADGSNQVWNWYKNPGDNRPGTIELVDANGIVARSYALPVLMPTRYRLITTPGGVVEELEVVTMNPTGELK